MLLRTYFGKNKKIPSSFKLKVAHLCVLQERVRMRYKLTFILGEQLFTEVGEVKAFPSPDR